MADFETITKKGERMIVVYPGCRAGEAARLRGHYKIALVPEALADTGLFGLTTPNLIKYGSGPRCHISLSSLGESRALAAVEELPVLGGGVVERQELAVENPAGLPAEELLAALGRDILSGGLEPGRI